MRASAFDLSSQTGWAAWDGTSPTPTLGRKRVLHWDRSEGLMLDEFRKWLGRHIDEHRPEAFGVEATAMGSHGDANTIVRQAEIRGMLHWAAHIKGIPIYDAAPSQWRKQFHGFGQGPRAKKGEPKPPPVAWKTLAKRRCAALGWDCQNDHNAAEAGGVLDWLITQKLGILPPWRFNRSPFLPLTENTVGR